jgi:hypothetical protein
MEKTKKKEFIKNLCNEVRDGLLRNVDKFPEDWDGHELREIIADEFDRERSLSRMGQGRVRAYKRERAAMSRLII